MVAFLEGPEVVIIVVILVVLFGATQIPKLARSVGQARREFERGLDEEAEPEPKAERHGRSKRAKKPHDGDDS